MPSVDNEKHCPGSIWKSWGLPSFREVLWRVCWGFTGCRGLSSISWRGALTALACYLRLRSLPRLRPALHRCQDWVAKCSKPLYSLVRTEKWIFFISKQLRMGYGLVRSEAGPARAAEQRSSRGVSRHACALRAGVLQHVDLVRRGALGVGGLLRHDYASPNAARRLRRVLWGAG